MTFTLNNKNLNEVLTTISKVLSSKNVMPILDNFIFSVDSDLLTVTAADTENWMNATIGLIEADGTGTFAVNAKDMLEAVKNLPEIPLTFVTEEKNKAVRIQYGNGVFSLPILEADDFPKVPEIMEEKTITIEIPEALLQENIARTVFATAQDELRPVMNGVYFDMTGEELTIVASDGHQLVRNRLTAIRPTETNKGSFILPKKPAAILKNILKKGDDMVTVRADEQRVEVVTEAFTLNSRLIEGRYPNYNSVIPKNNTSIVTVDRVTLIAVLKRITPFANDSSNLVKVHVEEGAMQLEAEDFVFEKTAMEQLTCEYGGNAITIGLKGSTLLAILENIKSTEIEIQLADPSRAALILPAQQPDEQHILMLQMPMLIND